MFLLGIIYRIPHIVTQHKSKHRMSPQTEMIFYDTSRTH
jgi:hypothetical protein